MDLRITTLLPPIVQIAVVLFLGIFAAVTITGRVSRQFEDKVFSRPDRHMWSHIVDYTVIPVAVFLVALAVVAGNWDSSQPFFGDVAWWRSAVGVGALVIAGLLPSIACLAAIWPLSRIADQRSPDAPLRSWAGKWCVVCFVGGVLLVPGGVIAAVQTYKWLVG